jgi:hypothetical protein
MSPISLNVQDAVRLILLMVKRFCLVVQVLPALREHRDEVLLRELFNRWNNHKLMVRWLSRFFNYLDRCEIMILNRCSNGLSRCLYQQMQLSNRKWQAEVESCCSAHRLVELGTWCAQQQYLDDLVK